MTTQDRPAQPMLREIFNRDLGEASAKVRDWLASRLEGASKVRIDEIIAAGGLSHELLIVEAKWREGSLQRSQGFVLRLDPVIYRKRLDCNLRREFLTLGVLHAEAKVPTPRPWFYEEGTAILGVPFFAMERVNGRIPLDTPPYQLEGWVKDLSTEERRLLWVSAIETMAKIHLTPLDKLSFLQRGDPGLSHLENHLHYWRRTYDWAMADLRSPIAEAAWNWLFANLPKDVAPGLMWGDARWANMMFKGLECSAVLDWEDVALASPLVDLGRWLFSDRFHESCGFTPLEGIGGRQATLDLWESLTGYSAASVRWFEILTAAYAIGIVARMARLQIQLSGRTLGPEGINVNAFTNILAEWMETV